MTRRLAVTLAVLLAAAAALVLLAPGIGVAVGPTVRAAATCSVYSTQAEAQRAADTRDGDGDGLYCESLPCPCSTATGRGDSADATPAPTRPARSCVKPRRLQNISFSKTKYPNIRRHFLDAVADGWPRTLVVNRRGADTRRERLLEDFPTRAGRDRDEYPPAVGRGRGKGLARGSSPRGWKGSVAYVPSSENRSHGSTLGIKLRRFCDSTRFRYVFY